MNFDKSLQEVIYETRWLRHLGLAVPQTAQSILLQEEKFSVYYQMLSHTLEVHSALQDLCTRHQLVTVRHTNELSQMLELLHACNSRHGHLKI